MPIDFLRTLFSPAKSQQFGADLAASLAKRYPPSLDANGREKLSLNRISKILETTYADAQEYQSQHKLGIWGKTRMSHAFRWKLVDLGYTTEFVKLATEGLVVYLNKPLSPPGPEKTKRKK